MPREIPKACPRHGGRETENCSFESFSLAWYSAAPGSGGIDRRSARELAARALTDARQFARGEQEHWMLLVGPARAGKTMLAAAIVREAVGKGIPARLTAFDDVLTDPCERRTLRAGKGAVARIAVLDDLRVDHAGTGWGRYHLFQLGEASPP